MAEDASTGTVSGGPKCTPPGALPPPVALSPDPRSPGDEYDNDNARAAVTAAAVIAQPYGVQCQRGGGARGSTSKTYREGEAGEAASSLLRSGSART